jgi:hypothetical protein
LLGSFSSLKIFPDNSPPENKEEYQLVAEKDSLKFTPS